jgi:stearoyl-CoA desaturase (delta-9 desaturase)
VPHDPATRNQQRDLDLAPGGAVEVLPYSGSAVLPLPAKSPSPHRVPAVDSVPTTATAEQTFWAKRFPHGIDWGIALWMAGMHIAAVAALWHFTWPAFATFLFLHWVTACLGITLGYHRLLTHSSMGVPRVLKYFFSMCGMLSAEGSPLMWVANHRKHHAHSDHEEDPHSPNHGFWWSHFVWFHPRRTHEEQVAMFKRWAPDLYKDPVQRFLNGFFPYFAPLTGVLLFGIGHYCFNAGVSFVLWGLCMRMVACYHSTWFVNSATHIWGYRNYETTDRSRNLWWVALISYGEGWHNNHHAHQRMARHGHRWFEIDMTYMVIRMLKICGLAWDVQDRLPGRGAAPTD